MKIRANAKINLGLFITGLNENKYHLLEATMIPVSLYDEISVEFSNNQYDSVTFENLQISENNTVTKVLMLFKSQFKIDKYFDIKVKKGIPSGAGLGGGSSDAAFVLKELIKLTNVDISNEELINIALKVGADVPFFLINKPCKMTGIGEKLMPFEVKNNYFFLLVKPSFGINTKECYQKFDELRIINKSNMDDVINLLKEGKELKNVHNDLFESAKAINPSLSNLENLIKGFSPKMLTLSGSGSTLVVYDNLEKLSEIELLIKSKENLELCEIVNII